MRASRRQFLRIVAVAGVAGLAARYGLKADTDPPLVTETRLLMGTVVNLTVAGAPLDQAQSAVRACLGRMTALEGRLSRFLPESDVSRLNREAYLADAGIDLLEILERSRSISESSAGAFDITVGPLLALYRQAQGAGKLPAHDAIQAVLPLVNYGQIGVSGKRVWFERPGMSLTLDGIAKGYVVDAGVAELRAAGFGNVLVEAGGDLLAAGTRDDTQAWRIGMQPARKMAGELSVHLHLRDQAAATSGDYQQAFSANLRHHHILDPRTGYSSPHLASATVMAQEAWLADALATAVMVLPPQAGLDLVARCAAQAFLVTKAGSHLITPGFPLT